MAQLHVLLQIWSLVHIVLVQFALSSDCRTELDALWQKYGEIKADVERIKVELQSRDNPCVPTPTSEPIPNTDTRQGTTTKPSPSDSSNVQKKMAKFDFELVSVTRESFAATNETELSVILKAPGGSICYWYEGLHFYIPATTGTVSSLVNQGGTTRVTLRKELRDKRHMFVCVSDLTVFNVNINSDSKQSSYSPPAQNCEYSNVIYKETNKNYETEITFRCDSSFTSYTSSSEADGMASSLRKNEIDFTFPKWSDIYNVSKASQGVDGVVVSSSFDKETFDQYYSWADNGIVVNLIDNDFVSNMQFWVLAERNLSGNYPIVPYGHMGIAEINDFVILEGEDMYIPCYGFGNPPPDLYLVKKGDIAGELYVLPRDKYYRFGDYSFTWSVLKSVSSSNNGEYYCKAELFGKSASHNFNITVRPRDYFSNQWTVENITDDRTVSVVSDVWNQDYSRSQETSTPLPGNDMIDFGVELISIKKRLDRTTNVSDITVTLKAPDGSMFYWVEDLGKSIPVSENGRFASFSKHGDIYKVNIKKVLRGFVLILACRKDWTLVNIYVNLEDNVQDYQAPALRCQHSSPRYAHTASTYDISVTFRCDPQTEISDDDREVNGDMAMVGKLDHRLDWLHPSSSPLVNMSTTSRSGGYITGAYSFSKTNYDKYYMWGEFDISYLLRNKNDIVAKVGFKFTDSKSVNGADNIIPQGQTGIATIDLKLTEGDHIHLICVGVSDPRADMMIARKYDDGRLEALPREKYVVINQYYTYLWTYLESVTLDQDGTYSCMALDSANRDITSSDFTVAIKPQTYNFSPGKIRTSTDKDGMIHVDLQSTGYKDLKVNCTADYDVPLNDGSGRANITLTKTEIGKNQATISYKAVLDPYRFLQGRRYLSCEVADTFQKSFPSYDLNYMLYIYDK